MKVEQAKHIEVLPGANGGAYSASRRLYESIKYSKKKTLIEHISVSEGIDVIFDGEDKGGAIILSTDVNALPMSENKLINWFKQKFETIKNRMTATGKIDKVAQDNDLFGWTIGKYLEGRYTSKNGTPYGENSLSVMIVGIDSDTLIKVAEELCREFQQESVLVKDFSSGNIMLVNGN